MGSLGIIKGRQDGNVYKPSLLHRLLRPKVSGNTVNGLGETEDRPASPVYHRVDIKHPWWWVQMSFYMRTLWDQAKEGHQADQKRTFRNKDLELERLTQVAEEPATEPEEGWTDAVKKRAMAHKWCDDVGIAAMHDNLYFDHDLAQLDKKHRTVIVLVEKMRYSIMKDLLKSEQLHDKPFWKNKFVAPMREIIKVYTDSHEAAMDLSQWIRSQGYPAEALGGSPGSKVNMLRSALEAGCGELGKHGSIIHKEFGSSVRFSVVLTDMPLKADAPVNFGADDFCESCQLCTNSCPPGAISDSKQMVRGHRKWYVDFDKCIPYFNDASSCGICLAACPWSRPGVADNLVKKMARRQQNQKT